MPAAKVTRRLSGDSSIRRQKDFNSSSASQVKSLTSPINALPVPFNISAGSVKIVYKILPYICKLCTADVVKTYWTSMHHIIHIKLQYNQVQTPSFHCSKRFFFFIVVVS